MTHNQFQRMIKKRYPKVFRNLDKIEYVSAETLYHRDDTVALFIYYVCYNGKLYRCMEDVKKSKHSKTKYTIEEID